MPGQLDGLPEELQLHATLIETPLGQMLAIADEEALCLLEFADRRGLEREVRKLNAAIVWGTAHPIRSIEKELKKYFKGESGDFQTPIKMLGSPFQKGVWEELKKIPFGETRSYAEIAKALNKPSAFRAVAQANGANQLAIVIPCHRVINATGALGGYAGGLSRKRWLIDHER